MNHKYARAEIVNIVTTNNHAYIGSNRKFNIKKIREIINIWMYFKKQLNV